MASAGQNVLWSLTYTSEVADTPRYRLLSPGTEELTVKLPAALGDYVLGATAYSAITGVGRSVAIAEIGHVDVEAGEAIVRHTQVVAGTDGRLMALPAAPGTYNVAGISISEAAAAGELVTVKLFPGNQVVVVV